MCSPNDFHLPKEKFCKKCLEVMKGFDGRMLGFRKESVHHSESQEKNNSSHVKSAFNVSQIRINSILQNVDISFKNRSTIITVKFVKYKYMSICVIYAFFSTFLIETFSYTCRFGET